MEFVLAAFFALILVVAFVCAAVYLIYLTKRGVKFLKDDENWKNDSKKRW